MNRKKHLGALAAFALALTSFAGVAGPMSPAAFADDRDDLVAKQKEQEKQIESTQSSLEGVDKDLQAVYLDLEETKSKIPVAEQELENAENELAEAERDQQIVAGQLDAAQGELTAIKDEITQGEESIEASENNLGEIARSQYRGDTMPSTMDLIVGASSSEDFLNSYQVWEALSRSQSTSLTEAEVATAQNTTRESRQSDVEEQIAELKDQADALVVEKEEKQDAAKTKHDDLLALQADFEKKEEKLQGQKDAFESSLSSLETKRNDTAAEIAKIDAENEKLKQQQEAAKKQQSSGSSSSAAKSAPVSNPSGSWLIPTVPAPVYVTSPFGMRQYPFGGVWMHNGVDLRSSCGEAQVAPADGVVAKTVPAPGNSTHGNQIFINLGVVNGSSYVAVTNHLSSFNVSAGQSVKQGQVIGWTGQTGQVTGCHVHMEVWKNGSVVDPMSFPAFTQR
ncbi:MAG: murein hydrolase activator EnvC family protein [Ancrocorticia sp.]|uniref:murein hydrolase activator EnvC family protein n=1 Tax=Ancrocorticia sp. TaxID=2593684 RepID=UPI003F8E68A1